MALVCLDTHFLIWGIKEESTIGQETMIPLAKAFFRHLDEEAKKVIIPSIVLFEFLMPVPPEKHGQLIKQINGKFMVAPLDAMAAGVAAEVWHKKKSSGLVQSLMAESNITRNKLKADCGIIGTAIARKADCIYSYDNDLIKMADGFIHVQEMPELKQQLPFTFE